jgi:hypothetical protein
MPVTLTSRESRNPLGQRSDRFVRGRLLLYTRRQDVAMPHQQEPGTIRRFFRGFAGYTGGPPPFSWTRNGFAPEPPVASAVSTPEFFLISTTDVLTVGNQRSNPMLRPVVIPRIQHTASPLTWVGNRQGRPTVRQRIASLGSRVPPANPTLGAGNVEPPA